MDFGQRWQKSEIKTILLKILVNTLELKLYRGHAYNILLLATTVSGEKYNNKLDSIRLTLRMHSTLLSLHQNLKRDFLSECCVLIFIDYKFLLIMKKGFRNHVTGKADIYQRVICGNLSVWNRIALIVSVGRERDCDT